MSYCVPFLRIKYAGAFYHVTSRGDRREDIYHDAKDRQVWLEVCSQVCSRFSSRCHAWCLMGNSLFNCESCSKIIWSQYLNAKPEPFSAKHHKNNLSA